MSFDLLTTLYFYLCMHYWAFEHNSYVRGEMTSLVERHTMVFIKLSHQIDLLVMYSSSEKVNNQN